MVAGLDELDDESRQAERACLAEARKDKKRYPPFEETSLATDSKLTTSTSSKETESLDPKDDKEPERDLSAGNMEMLNSTGPQETDEDGARRARLVQVIQYSWIL